MSTETLQAGVSVVVCCHNSADRLPATLRHLAAQVVPTEVPWEVIVVDNASTDNTAQVAQSMSGIFDTHVQFCIVGEPAAGLSFARQRGIKTAHFECTVFCDDDNRLGEDYLFRAYQLMRNNQDVGLAGGAGQLGARGETPSWFDRYQRAYAVGPQAHQSGYTDNHLYGAGMVVRTSVLRRAYEMGFASQLTGRRADTLAAGEDSEINCWVSSFGYRNWYESGLAFQHDIAATRLTWLHLKALFRGFGIADVTIGLYNNAMRHRETLSRWPVQVAIAVLRLIGAVVPRRDRAPSLLWTRRGATLGWLLRNPRVYNRQRSAIGRMVALARRESQHRLPEATATASSSSNPR